MSFVINNNLGFTFGRFKEAMNNLKVVSFNFS